VKIFYDTEFIERGASHPISLISIGMARDDGAEYYAVNANLSENLVRHHEWDGMRRDVWPQLPYLGNLADYILDHRHPDVKNRRKIAGEVEAFVLGVDEPELWASYSDYDHVVLCQLFGTMAQLPKGFPMLTRDVKDYSIRVGDPEWPVQTELEHHALHDARHASKVWRFLRGIELGATAAAAEAPPTRNAEDGGNP
jgi:hypothetical protein